MSAQPKISNSEWEVMSVLWDADEALGLTEIIERLPEASSRNPKTINTFLTRLAAKNGISIRKVGRTNLYSASVSRDECVKQESRDFLKRIFRGATAPMMMSLIEDADLKDGEIEKLQALLDKKKGKKS